MTFSGPASLLPNNIFQTGYEFLQNICAQANNKNKLPINIQNSRLHKESSVLVFGKYLAEAITKKVIVTIVPKINIIPEGGIPNTS